MRGYKERADKAESELAALRAELAAAEADTIDATERVILMRRDNQRAAAARRVAAYCRMLRRHNSDARAFLSVLLDDDKSKGGPALP